MQHRGGNRPLPGKVPMRTSTALLTGLLLLLAAPAARAHHLWVVRADSAYTVARGMAPDRFDAYDPARVTRAAAWAPDGSPIELARQDADSSVSFVARRPAALVALRCDWGDRVMTTQGKKFLNRQAAEEAGLRVLQAFVSTQCAKALFDTCAAVRQPVGLDFEMVPLSDPLRASAEGELHVKLLFDGEPLADAEVVSLTGERSTTGADGVARLVLSPGGLQLFVATHRKPLPDSAELDFHKFMAFLSFEVR